MKLESMTKTQLIAEIKKLRNKTIHRQFLRPSDLANELGCGLSTIWLWVKQGKIQSKKLSRKIAVFDIDHINNVFDSNIEKEIRIYEEK